MGLILRFKSIQVFHRSTHEFPGRWIRYILYVLMFVLYYSRKHMDLAQSFTTQPKINPKPKENTKFA